MVVPDSSSFLNNLLQFIFKRIKQMSSESNNWYTEYDYKTLNIINDAKFQTIIFKEVGDFACYEGLILKDQAEQQNIPDWINETAEGVAQMLTLLYNFYNIEYKLSKNQEVKIRFLTICSVLKVENQYTKFFYTMSQEFRINRIMASLLRLNKFLNLIVDELRILRKHMDQTLLDNLEEVELFMQQRLMQILQITKKQRDSDINILLLEGISLIVRMSGDPTMKGILDINKSKQIIDKILKSNQIYDQFRKEKEIASKNFDQNKYFEVEMPMQEDPNAKKSLEQNDEEDEDNFG